MYTGQNETFETETGCDEHGFTHKPQNFFETSLILSSSPGRRPQVHTGKCAATESDDSRMYHDGRRLSPLPRGEGQTGFSVLSLLLPLSLRTKSNKTERSQFRSKIAHAVSRTYDDTISSRSIFPNHVPKDRAASNPKTCTKLAHLLYKEGGEVYKFFARPRQSRRFPGEGIVCHRAPATTHCVL